jgi:hypothetical protein
MRVWKETEIQVTTEFDWDLSVFVEDGEIELPIIEKDWDNDFQDQTFDCLHRWHDRAFNF